MQTEFLVSDQAFLDAKIYMWETLLKIKDFLIQEEELIHGFRKELMSMARNLGLLIDHMEYVEEESEGLKLASGEGKRALKSFLNYEVDLASNACHFIRSLMQTRAGQSDYGFDDLSALLNFNNGMKWMEKTNFTRAHISQKFKFYGKELKKGKESARIIGLEEDVQKLSRNLSYDEQEILVIVGVGGIGKTTLAKELCANILENYDFHLQVWVTIPQEFIAKDVMRNILKQIPALYKTKLSQYTEESAEELAEELLHILRAVRCIIVLDDLLASQDWQYLRTLLPALGIGKSRFIITTRNRELAEVEYGSNHIIHQMRTLSESQGWELFNAWVHVPVQLEQLAKEILRRCMGLPLAILTVVDVLSRRAATKEQWLEVLNQVSQKNQRLIFHTLSDSFDALPPHMKECLSCVSIFHENYDIPVRRVIVLWVAEGLVYQHGDNADLPEHLAEKQLMEFIQLDMIQAVEWKLNGKVKTCRLNYFLRDNFSSINNKEHSLHSRNKGVSSMSSRSTSKLRLADHLNFNDKCFLHIHGVDGISRSTFRKHYRHLHSFVSFDSREGPLPGEAIGRFLLKGIAAGCLKMLRVLDLEGVFRPQLPESAGALLQVRYLGLRSSYLEVLPSSIGKLLNLQTLDLKHTCIRSLPSSIWKIHQLRHLYLSESYRSRVVAPPITSSFLDIQTLWGGFIDDETLVSAGLDKLINIKKLGLVCQLKLSKQIEMADWVTRLDHLETLRLKSIDERVHPSYLYLPSLSGLTKLSSIYLLGRLENPAIVHEFPQNLSELSLSLSGLKIDPMRQLGKLPNLRILNLYSGSYSGKFLVCPSGSFPLLQVLNLWKLEELEVWILEKGAMRILRDVEIRSCTKLRRIPKGLRHLGHCRELKLTKMPTEFKARVAKHKGVDWPRVAHVPSILIKD